MSVTSYEDVPERSAGFRLWSSLYTNSFYLMAASVVNAAFGFLFWTAAARLYHPREVGLAAAAISMGGLLAMLSTLGLDQAMVRFLPRSPDDRAIVNSSLTIGSVVALGLCLAFLAGLPLWSPALLSLRQSPLFAMSFTAATVFTAVTTVMAGVYLAKRLAVFAFIQSTVFSTTKVLLAVLLAIVPHAVGLVGAWALGLVTAVICGVVLFLPRVVARDYRFQLVVERAAVSDMTHFAFANYVAAVLWSASPFLLPILVVNLAGPEANAYFYVAINVGGLLTIIPVAISQSLFAHGSQDEKQLTRHTSESIRLTLLLLVPAIVGMLFLGGKVLLVFGRSYAEGGTLLLRLFVLSTLPLSVNLLFFSIKKVQQRMAWVIASTGWILVVTLVFSALLLPMKGPLGAGVAWLVAQTSTAIVILIRYLLIHRW